MVEAVGQTMVAMVQEALAGKEGIYPRPMREDELTIVCGRELLGAAATVIELYPGVVVQPADGMDWGVWRLDASPRRG